MIWAVVGRRLQMTSLLTSVNGQAKCLRPVLGDTAVTTGPGPVTSLDQIAITHQYHTLDEKHPRMVNTRKKNAMYHNVDNSQRVSFK